MELTDFDTEISVIAEDPFTGYLFRAWYLGANPNLPGMKLVQRVGVEGLRAIASVYKCYFDIIGDPVEDTGSRRIVFVPSEQYRSDRVSPPGICFVYGPCGKCGKYFSNYQRHLDDELGLSDLFDDAFSDDDDQVDPDADLLDVELLDPDQMQEVLDDVGEHFVNDVMTDL